MQQPMPQETGKTSAARPHPSAATEWRSRVTCQVCTDTRKDLENLDFRVTKPGTYSEELPGAIHY